jgi:hypothetical protein
MLQDLFNFLNQGWVGSLTGFIGIVIGILGIYSYKISKSHGLPTVQKHSLRIIEKEKTAVSDDLEILFKGKKVERLTKTIIVFWNDGTETINGSDVVASDKISFSFSHGERILSSKIICVTRAVNHTSLVNSKDQNNKVNLIFDFLDPNDGVTIELLHTDKKRYPSITGTIKGVPSGIYDAGSYIDDNTQSPNTYINVVFKKRKYLYYSALAIGLTIVLLGLLPSSIYEYIETFLKSEQNKNIVMPERWLFIVVGGIYAFMPVYLLWSGRRKYPKVLWHDRVDS